MPFSSSTRNLDVSFFATSLHWKNRWTSCSVREYFFLLKPRRLSIPLMFSLSLIIVMLSLPTLPRFSWVKFRAWSTAHLALSAKLLNLPTWLYYSSPLATNQQPGSVQNSSCLLACCLRYRSFIHLLDALSLLSSLSLLSLELLDLPCSDDWQEVPREIFSIHRTCYQKLVLSLSGIPLHCLKTKNQPPLLCHFFLLLFHHPSPAVRVFVLWMYVCVGGGGGGGCVKAIVYLHTHIHVFVFVYV